MKHQEKLKKYEQNISDLIGQLELLNMTHLESLKERSREGQKKCLEK